MTDSLQKKARVIAQMVAKTSAAGLVFDEASSVTTLLEAFKEMHDVEFAIVLKKDGNKFAYNESKCGQYSGKVSELVSKNATSYSDGDIVMELYSMQSGNEKVGYCCCLYE